MNLAKKWSEIWIEVEMRIAYLAEILKFWPQCSENLKSEIRTNMWLTDWLHRRERVYELATKVCMIKAKEKMFAKKKLIPRPRHMHYYMTLKTKQAFFPTRVPSEFLNSDWKDENVTIADTQNWSNF